MSRQPASTPSVRETIEELPAAAPVKTFEFSGKDLFDKQDSAKLKHTKTLNPGGDFLANNDFGCAVIVVSAGMEGDSQKDLALTQARAMVVRNYLVGHFAFDDTELKTMGKGKEPESNPENRDWGSVKILVYPSGVELPEEKQQPASGSAKAPDQQPASAPASKK
jgi:hypothetical protein